MNRSSRLAIGGSFVLALGLLPPFVGSATSAGETCQGQPATIVVTEDGADVVGTPGPDVVVIDLPLGAASVDTDGGDDVVCVRGEGFNVSLDLGSGDDSVAVEEGAASSSVRAFLGQGIDTYVGGPGRDEVTAAGNSVARDTGDSVTTGDGDDRLNVRGVVGAVDMGSGDDYIDMYDVTLSEGIDAGDGIDTLAVLGMNARVDMRRERFRVNGSGGVDLRGVVKLRLRVENADVLGAGDDNVFSVSACDARIKGGRGDDILVSARLNTFVSDCSSGGTFRWFGNQGDDQIRGSLKDDEIFGGPGNDIIDDAKGNDRVSGGGGNDRVYTGGGADVLFGGNGNDKLGGGSGDDRIYGGAGRDKAVGHEGRDACVAEIRRSCER